VVSLGMRFSRAAWPVFGAACLSLALASACGSSSSTNVNGNGTGADGSGANGSGHAGTSGTTGPVLGLAGESATNTSGGSSAVDECAGNLIEAQRIPLDMYVMLDVSGSMLEATAGDATITKWEAVSSALSDFVSDPASDGMGMGLQVFPIRHPDAPASCKTNNDCGNQFGPCFLKTCWNYPDGLVPCEAAADCGQFGPCVTFGNCAKNLDFVCNGIGKDCGTDPDTNMALGTCVTPASSVCLATADCRPATYAAPATPIATLPGAKTALVTAIQTAMPEPGGLTPSGPALQGAIDQASTWAKAHPERQVVAVLATDGLPTLCEPVAITDVAALAAAGRKLNPAVSTFVIGVVGPTDTDAPANLNSVAKSGGTTRAFIVDTQGDVQKQFRDALDKIRASGLSCELAVPEAEAGKTLDYGQVNVSFDSGTGANDLLSWPDASGCGADGGWYYDVDPAKGTPKRIIACPTTCTAFEKTDMGSVQIKLGCKTRMVVK
jgi:von Willebrand factor type A domain